MRGQPKRTLQAYSNDSSQCLSIIPQRYHTLETALTFSENATDHYFRLLNSSVTVSDRELRSSVFTACSIIDRTLILYLDWLGKICTNLSCDVKTRWRNGHIVHQRDFQRTAYHSCGAERISLHWWPSASGELSLAARQMIY